MSKWDNDKHNFLIELKASDKYTWQEIADKMTDKFNHVYTREQCRSRWRTNRHKIDIDPRDTYATRITKNADGTIETDQLIAISKEQLKDESYILKAHGYDDSWEVMSHQYSMWNHHNKQDGTITLYTSKLRVKPKEQRLSTDELINKITESTEPIKINTAKYMVEDKRALGIYYMDMHFGINTLQDYKDVLTETIAKVKSRVWQEIIITFGSDLLHVDNLKNTTANQTRIEDVDVLQMIEDAKKFYITIIDTAIKQSNKANIIYVKGNHDETTSHLLAHWLDAYYKNVEKVSVDYSIEERKVHMYERVFMAFSHGDKGGRRSTTTLPARYPEQWAKAKAREKYTGHIHHEKTLDENGITDRSLPTAAKTDQYHKDNSYVGTHKRFAMFEYTADRVKSIHYV